MNELQDYLEMTIKAQLEEQLTFDADGTDWAYCTGLIRANKLTLAKLKQLRADETVEELFPYTLEALNNLTIRKSI